MSCTRILFTFQWQNKSFETFLFSPGLTSMPPWEINKKIRNEITSEVTNLKKPKFTTNSET